MYCIQNISKRCNPTKSNSLHPPPFSSPIHHFHTKGILIVFGINECGEVAGGNLAPNMVLSEYHPNLDEDSRCVCHLFLEEGADTFFFFDAFHFYCRPFPSKFTIVPHPWSVTWHSTALLEVGVYERKKRKFLKHVFFLVEILVTFFGLGQDRFFSLFFFLVKILFSW